MLLFIRMLATLFQIVYEDNYIFQLTAKESKH